MILKKKYKFKELVEKLKKETEIEEFDESVVKELYSKYSNRPWQIGFNRIKNNIEPVQTSVDRELIYLSARDWFQKKSGKITGAFLSFYDPKEMKIYSGLDRSGQVADQLKPLRLYIVRGDTWTNTETTFNISKVKGTGKKINLADLKKSILGYIKRREKDIVNFKSGDNVFFMGKFGMRVSGLTKFKDNQPSGEYPIFVRSKEGKKVKPYPGFQITVNSLLNEDESARVRFDHQIHGESFFGDILTVTEIQRLMKSNDKQKDLAELLFGIPALFLGYVSRITQSERDGQIIYYKNVYCSFMVLLDTESKQFDDTIEHLAKNINVGIDFVQEEEEMDLDVDIEVSDFGEESPSLIDESQFIEEEELVEDEERKEVVDKVKENVAKENGEESTEEDEEVEIVEPTDDIPEDEDVLGCLGNFDPDSDECKECEKSVRCKQMLLENLEDEIGEEKMSVVTKIIEKNSDINPNKIAEKLSLSKSIVKRIKSVIQ